jgi:hypothetical protein
MERLVQRPLTDQEMEHVLHVIADASNPTEIVIGAIVSTFEALMGAEAWDAAPDGGIDPTQYAIPEDQVHVIGSAMLAQMDAVTDVPGFEHVNVLLDWMNTGPSSYVRTAPEVRR